MPHRVLRAETCVRELQSCHFDVKRIVVRCVVRSAEEDGLGPWSWRWQGRMIGHDSAVATCEGKELERGDMQRE